MEVAGGRRIEIAIGPVGAAAEEIADPRGDPPAHGDAAVDRAEGADVEAGRTGNGARLVEPRLRGDVDDRGQLAAELRGNAAGHHFRRLHVARVERVGERLGILVGHRHAVDDILNLAVRSADVDPAVLAGNEPRRGEQHRRQLLARRGAGQLVDQVGAEIDMRSGRRGLEQGVTGHVHRFA